MKLTRIVAAGTALSAALFLAGCGQEKTEPSTDPGGSSATTPSASGTPSGFGTDPVVEPGRNKMGGDLGPVGTVSVAHNDGFDTVTWEFTGKGVPQYAVEYVDQPTQDGSGDPVEVAGDAFIQVSVSSVAYPENPGQNSPKPAPADQLKGTVIAEAGAIDGGFEGYGMTWIGVTGQQRPFRVSVLSNPTRIVVDVVNTP